MKPLRSHTRILSLLRRALMNANIGPASGSCWITSRAKIASPSICFLISTGARCKYTRSMPRSGRSIPSPRQHRRPPARRWPLATLDRPPWRAHQPAHQGAARRPRDLGDRYRRARHPHRHKLALALARPVCPRQCTAPAQRRDRVVHRSQLKTLRLRIIAQRHSGPARSLQRLHRNPLLLRQCLRHRVPPHPRGRYTARIELTTEERASLSAYVSKAKSVRSAAKRSISRNTIRAAAIAASSRPSTTARQEEMATLLCDSQSKNCWHVFVFAVYQTLIPANIPTAT